MVCNYSSCNCGNLSQYKTLTFTLCCPWSSWTFDEPFLLFIHMKSFHQGLKSWIEIDTFDWVVSRKVFSRLNLGKCIWAKFKYMYKYWYNFLQFNVNAIVSYYQIYGLFGTDTKLVWIRLVFTWNKHIRSHVNVALLKRLPWSSVSSISTLTLTHNRSAVINHKMEWTVVHEHNMRFRIGLVRDHYYSLCSWSFATINDATGTD